MTYLNWAYEHAFFCLIGFIVIVWGVATLLSAARQG